jgi:hypothetical protein
MTLLALLSPKARALVDAGRSAARPTAADRERIQAALRARLGPEAFGPEPAGAGTAAGASTSTVPLVAGAIAGVLAVGGIVFFATRPAPAPPPPPERVPAVETASEVVPDVSPAPEAPAPVAPELPSAAPSESRAPARAKPDRLAQEVALLSSATKSLNAGRAAEALQLLDEHRQKFPNGLLAEERRAARARALCSLGRVAEAEAELARLAPRSPAAARARQVCDRARAKSR